LHRLLGYHSRVTDGPARLAEPPTGASNPAGPKSPSGSPSWSGPAASALPALSLPSLRRREAPARARAFVFLDPDGAFSATVARPRPLLCLLVAALFSLATPVAFFASAERAGGLDVVLVDGLKKSGRFEKIPPAARDKALQAMVPVTKVLLPVGAVARRLAWIVSIAALAFALLRATRPQAGFAVVVACAAVGAAPLFVKDVVAACALWTAADLRALDATNIVLSNPTAWLFSGAEARTAPAVLLRAVDLFELWACAWMALGVERAVGGRTRVPWMVVAVAYGVLAAMSAAQAAITSTKL
jgi:hypothetical protein